MTKLNAKQFAGYLENMGFFVRDTAADSFTATIDTENGTFEMVITDAMIVANKPNGTTKYWDNLTDARARSYVRQVLDFNKPLPKPEPEVEETPQAETETPEPEAPKTVHNEALGETTTARPVEGMSLDWWEDGETHTAPAWRGDNHRYFVMVDGTLYGVRDAFVAGTLRPVLGGAWIEVAESEQVPEEAMEEDDGTPKFAELTPGQLDYVENAGIGAMFVTPEQAARVTDELRLRDLSPEGVTATRNAVVRHLADLATEAREAGDWDAFDRYHNNMSGICAVIDLRMAS